MKSLVAMILLLSLAMQGSAQGCVAIRNNGGACMLENGMQNTGQFSTWTLAINNRYFRSFRHFIGREEQKQRAELGNEVINHSFSTEWALSRILSTRWSIGLFVPIVDNKRSSLYEHDGKNRYSTRSFGLGDIRLAAYYWLLDPVTASKTNVQVGWGLKFATGDYRYMDYFHKTDSTRILGPVDQSIQPGDGGTGVSGELNAFHRLSPQAGLYANAFYLVNPREQNGVSTARGGSPSPAAIAYGSDVMSVPDQFMVRVGGNYSVAGFTFSAGVRMEGLPAHDLLGGDDGFRRPGYVLSAEPSVVYRVHKTQLYVSLPYAFERNRTQSRPDEIRTRMTGVYYKGDAAFADYSINFGAAFSF